MAPTPPSAIWSTTSTACATASCPSSRTGRCRSSGCTAVRRRSCRRTSRSTRLTGCRPCSCGRRPRSARSSYALCNDRRTLLWFANQRAVEYHPTLTHRRAARPRHPPGARPRPAGGATRSRRWSRWRTSCGRRSTTSGCEARSRRVVRRVCTCSSPSTTRCPSRTSAAVTRAIATRAAALDPDIATTAFIKEDREGKVFVDSTRVGGATVVAAYSPRVRPGVPVSFPVEWDELDRIAPARLHRPHRARTARGSDAVERPDGRSAVGTHRRWSRRVTRSRSPGCTPCTRANAGRGTAAPAVDRWLARRGGG